jgi:hypothetical protein
MRSQPIRHSFEEQSALGGRRLRQPSEQLAVRDAGVLTGCARGERDEIVALGSRQDPSAQHAALVRHVAFGDGAVL